MLYQNSELIYIDEITLFVALSQLSVKLVSVETQRVSSHLQAVFGSTITCLLMNKSSDKMGHCTTWCYFY